MQSEDAEMREMGYHKAYVVYCKDCKYYKQLNSVCPYLEEDKYYKEFPNKDDYCSRGKRKEVEE